MDLQLLQHQQQSPQAPKVVALQVVLLLQMAVEDLSLEVQQRQLQGAEVTLVIQATQNTQGPVVIVVILARLMSL